MTDTPLLTTMDGRPLLFAVRDTRPDQEELRRWARLGRRHGAALVLAPDLLEELADLMDALEDEADAVE